MMGETPLGPLEITVYCHFQTTHKNVPILTNQKLKFLTHVTHKAILLLTTKRSSKLVANQAAAVFKTRSLGTCLLTNVA